jgi:hypothetical protein
VGRLDSQIEVLQKQNKSIIDIRFGEMWSVLNELKAQLTILETYKRKQDMSLKQKYAEVLAIAPSIKSIVSRKFKISWMN